MQILRAEENRYYLFFSLRWVGNVSRAHVRKCTRSPQWARTHGTNCRHCYLHKKKTCQSIHMAQTSVKCKLLTLTVCLSVVVSFIQTDSCFLYYIFCFCTLFCVVNNVKYFRKRWNFDVMRRNTAAAAATTTTGQYCRKLCVINPRHAIVNGAWFIDLSR